MKPVAAAMVDRSEADAYDLRLIDDEPAPAPTPTATPASRRQPAAAKPSTPSRPDIGSYDLKPDVTPVVKPPKPATPAVVAQAAAPQPERKGLLARLFSRGK